MIELPNQSMFAYLRTDNNVIREQVKDLLTYNKDQENEVHYYLEDDNTGEISILFGMAEHVSNKLNLPLQDDRVLGKPDKHKIDEVFNLFVELDKQRNEEYPYEIRPHQPAATRKCLIRKRGIVEIATGGGKTEIMSALCHLIDGTILFLNNTNFIIDQAYKRFIKRGVPQEDVALWNGAKSLDKRVILCSTQTLNNGIKKNDPAIMALLEKVTAIFFDEGHHLSAESWQRIAIVSNPEYLLSFTGSAFEEQGDPYAWATDALMVAVTGGVIHRTTSLWLRNKGYLATPYVHYLSYRLPVQYYKSQSSYWQQVKKKFITANQWRNDLALELLVALNDLGLTMLVLVPEKENHGIPLLKALRSRGITSKYVTGDGVYVIHPHGEVDIEPGGMDNINQFLEFDGNIVLGSTVLDEGVDLRNVDGAVNMGGGRSSRRLIQRIGRVIRPKNYLNIGLFFDFNDQYHYMTKNHSNLRRKVVEYEQYPIIDSYAEIMNLAHQIAESKKSYMTS